MAYNRYHQTSSPWASGAPPMYGSAHAGPPPPAYGAPAYGHSSSPWNATPMRQSWGAPTPAPQPHYMQHNPQRAAMRGHMAGPTGKRANMGSWDGPPNKKFAGKGGGRGGGGGQWKGPNQQKFQNQRQFQNRDNRRNNREVNRAKQNDTQTERRQQHDQAQKAAESLDKKEYSIEQSVSKLDAEANKALEIDSAQEKYVLAVFGYVCQVCNVFLKDKGARFQHCQNDDHMTKFNAVEEEAKKESEKKKEEEKDKEIATKSTGDDSAKEVTESNETQENGNNNKDSIEDEVLNQETESESKTEDAKDIEVNQEEENKDNEDTDVGEDEASQPIEELGGALSKGLPSDDIPQTNADAPNLPADRHIDVSPQIATNYAGGDYSANRGRGAFNRGRGGVQGRGGPRGRGRNRGRGRK